MYRKQEVSMFNIGPWELGLILLVALIVVGPGKLPEVAKAIGKGINEFKKVTNGYKQEFQEAMQDLEKQASLENKAESTKTTAGEAYQPQSIEEAAERFDTDLAGQNQQDTAMPEIADSNPNQ